jgi:hypothetical protein
MARTIKAYCTQNNGDCSTCGLVNYGRDCLNNPIDKDKLRTNKKSAYAKWLSGWTDGGGWTGATTVCDAFKRAQTLKDSGVSWYMLGKLMASEQAFGRQHC